MGVSVVRWGGNARSRHNWEINASNVGADGGFVNRSQGDKVPGSTSLTFHQRNSDFGAKSILTIPMIGWVAKDQSSVSQPSDTADENRSATSFPSFANKNDTFEYPPDREDDAVYQDEWVHYLTQQLGTSAENGIAFYEMDNEPMLWFETHSDIRPEPLGYQDHLDIFLEYSNAVKQVDSTANILGPSAWGWTSYFLSSLDKGSDNYKTAPQRTLHDRQPRLQWFLEQVRLHDQQTGQRSLDYLGIHYFPQSGVFSEKIGVGTQAKRLRSTRSLWDPTYRDESWIDGALDGPHVNLIPRMKEWIDDYYPGTKLAITEWNFGASRHISGGLATAEVLGIFGREGVDLATYWGNPFDGSPVYWAFRMFRNYDGRDSRFGNLSINAESSDSAFVSAYASLSDESGQVSLILINKSPTQTADVQVNFGDSFRNSSFSVFRYGDDTSDGIIQMHSETISGTQLSYKLLPYSIYRLTSEP